MTTLREAAQNVVEVWKLYGTTESLRGWMEILEAALAEPVQQGCEHCNQPLYAAVKCRVCGRVTKSERNFCPRCGKRTQDIHTCTPPGDCDVHG